jgi:monoamine oxidase
MRDNMKSALAQFVMRVGILGYFAVDPDDMSFLHLLFYVSAGGGVEVLHTSGLAERFDGGSQVVSDRVAQQLGRRVMLKMPVREIDQSGNMIVVKTDQDRFEARHVIVALPPTLAGRIFYRPRLTANRDGLTQRAFMATTIKCHAVYPTPFWRDKGLSGQVISDETVVDVTHDNSPPSGRPGIMAGFLFGKHGREWADQPEADLRRTVLGAFGKYFGPEATSPTEFYIANWPNEIWSRGCYSGIMPTGVWTGYPNALRAPVGRIHWAGTETVWPAVRTRV